MLYKSGRPTARVRGSPSFFERVYEVVCQIPSGRVASYGQVAALVGHPRAARTVGWALHALPEGSDVPWHRVINGRGRISTSRRERSASLQAELLLAESVGVGPDGEVALGRFLWRPARRRAGPRRERPPR